MKNTVADLIEYLKTLPPDATVRVCVEKYGSYGNYTGTDPLSDDNVYFYEKVNMLQIGLN